MEFQLPSSTYTFRPASLSRNLDSEDIYFPIYTNAGEIWKRNFHSENESNIFRP